MLRTLGFVSLLVLLAAGFTSSLAGEAPAATAVDGAKGEATQGRGDAAIPATTQVGLVIMVLLVMTASTGALFSGGILRGRPPERPAPAATSRAAPAPAPKAAERPKRVPKAGPPTRAQVRHSDQRLQARKGWNVSRRGMARPGGRRRGGPGCRGVR
jgi:hypothetical protein